MLSYLTSNSYGFPLLQEIRLAHHQKCKMTVVLPKVTALVAKFKPPLKSLYLAEFKFEPGLNSVLLGFVKSLPSVEHIVVSARREGLSDEEMHKPYRLSRDILAW